MKVEWNKRALVAHRKQQQVTRVRARLTDKPFTDLAIGIPVITEDHVKRLTDLQRDLTALQDRFEDTLTELRTALSVLRCENHPEGWADIHITERDKDLITARVTYRPPKMSAEEREKAARQKRADRRRMRTFIAGYRARSR